jgi:hypothetical protein
MSPRYIVIAAAMLAAATAYAGESNKGRAYFGAECTRERRRLSAER